MTASDRREELEAIIRSERTAHGKCREQGRCPFCEAGISIILTYADKYAQAVTDEGIAARVAETIAGRERLEQATWETGMRGKKWRRTA